VLQLDPFRYFSEQNPFCVLNYEGWGGCLCVWRKGWIVGWLDCVLLEWLIMCENCVLRSGVSEDCRLPECDAVLLRQWFPTLRRNVAPSPQVLLKLQALRSSTTSQCARSTRRLTVPSACQEIPRILCNSNVHHRFHCSPLLVAIPSHINPVDNLQAHYLRTDINTTAAPPSTPTCSEQSLFVRFPHQNSVCISLLSHPRHIHRPAHHHGFHRPNAIW